MPRLMRYTQGESRRYRGLPAVAPRYAVAEGKTMKTKLGAAALTLAASLATTSTLANEDGALPLNELRSFADAVSYTHLTLPTNREV